MNIEQVGPFWGVYKYGVPWNRPPDTASEAINVTIRSGRLQLRGGSSFMETFTATSVRGLVWLVGYETTTAAEEFMTFASLDGTLRPYSYKPATDTFAEILNGASRVSLASADWHAVTFKGNAIVFNNTGAPQYLHEIGDSTSFSRLGDIETPAAPTLSVSPGSGSEWTQVSFERTLEADWRTDTAFLAPKTYDTGSLCDNLANFEATEAAYEDSNETNAFVGYLNGDDNVLSFPLKQFLVDNGVTPYFYLATYNTGAPGGSDGQTTAVNSGNAKFTVYFPTSIDMSNVDRIGWAIVLNYCLFTGDYRVRFHDALTNTWHPWQNVDVGDLSTLKSTQRNEYAVMEPKAGGVGYDTTFYGWYDCDVAYADGKDRTLWTQIDAIEFDHMSIEKYGSQPTRAPGSTAWTYRLNLKSFLLGGVDTRCGDGSASGLQFKYRYIQSAIAGSWSPVATILNSNMRVSDNSGASTRASELWKRSGLLPYATPLGNTITIATDESTTPSVTQIQIAVKSVDDADTEWREFDVVDDATESHSYALRCDELHDLPELTNFIGIDDLPLIWAIPFKGRLVWLAKRGFSNVMHTAIGTEFDFYDQYDDQDEVDTIGATFSMTPNYSDEPVVGYALEDVILLGGQRGIYFQYGSTPQSMSPIVQIPSLPGCLSAKASCVIRLGNRFGVAYMDSNKKAVYFVTVARGANQFEGYQFVSLTEEIGDQFSYDDYVLRWNPELRALYVVGMNDGDTDTEWWIMRIHDGERRSWEQWLPVAGHADVGVRRIDCDSYLGTVGASLSGLFKTDIQPDGSVLTYRPDGDVGGAKTPRWKSNQIVGPIRRFSRVVVHPVTSHGTADRLAVRVSNLERSDASKSSVEVSGRLNRFGWKTQASSPIIEIWFIEGDEASDIVVDRLELHTLQAGQRYGRES